MGGGRGWGGQSAPVPGAPGAGAAREEERETKRGGGKKKKKKKKEKKKKKRKVKRQSENRESFLKIRLLLLRPKVFSFHGQK